MWDLALGGLGAAAAGASSALAGAAGSAACAGRIPLLQRQFFEQKVDVLALQETRLRKATMVRGESYFMLSSAAQEKGQYGCELWVLNRAHSRKHVFKYNPTY